MDPYIDPATGCLHNLLGAQTSEELKMLEGIQARAGLGRALAHLATCPAIDMAAWRDVHRILFGALYPFAGQIRSIGIGRADGRAVFNSPPEIIEAECEARLAAIAGETDDAFRANLAAHYAELNFQHPFREGNGRTLKCLFTEISRRHGTAINWTGIAKAEYEAALEHWGAKGEIEPLAKVFDPQVITKVRGFKLYKIF